MAEALKNMYNQEFLTTFANHILEIYPKFEKNQFITKTMDAHWDGLELRARMKQIASCYHSTMNSSYKNGIKILLATSKNRSGFADLFFCDYVSMYGTDINDWDLSMEALECFTQKSSAEFAIRTFFKIDYQKTMTQMKEFAKSKNEHLRRLASEGCRTRLPWGEQVPALFKNTKDIIQILNMLKNDPSIYVRKSVGNNLNDLSKDTPELVLYTLQKWDLTSPNTKWIAQHGCRTLIKKGHLGALSLLGYTHQDDLNITDAHLSSTHATCMMGETIQISYSVTIQTKQESNIKIGLIVDFVKANGKTSPKIFHLKDIAVKGETKITGNKKYKWKNLTTRKHYRGIHTFHLSINGIHSSLINITLI